jgi:arylsulfatase A-like enzyme/Tfp pilus assembly protein PilF
MSGAWRTDGGRQTRSAQRRLLLAALAVVAVALPAAGCRRGERFPQAPVVLISIDTLRSDRVGVYGAKTGATPKIDAFARDAVLFERAYSHYPLTLPSHVSLLTGELPGTHGVRDNVGYPFTAAKHPFLPLLLKKLGYDTGGAVSAFVLRRETGLGDGFDYYESSLRPPAHVTLDMVQRPGGETAKLALDWLRGRADAKKPFFLFFHLYEPHSPYEPPAPFAARFRDPYDGEVAAADDIVGSFLQQLRDLGVYDRAIVVLLSDHGEGLDEHGEGQHGLFLYRESLQVPLLLKLPKSRRGGTRVAAPVQLVDVAPTVLGLVGADVPKELPGKSLLAIADDPQAPPRQLYAETFYPRLHFGWSELSSLIEGKFHYIDGPAPELFDVVADAGERANVLERERRAYASLRGALAKYPRELEAPAPSDPETAKQLAALGYAAGVAKTSGPLPDPRTKRDVIVNLGRAVALAHEDRHAEAVALYAKLLATDPQMPDTWAFYARALEKLGRRDEAADAYEKALEVGSPGPQLAVDTAEKLVELGRVEDGEKLAQTMLREVPDRAYEVLAKAALARRDLDAARGVLQRAAAEQHASERLRGEVARALAEAGAVAEAASVLEPVAKDADPPTLNLLGIALSDSGRHQEARAVLERAVAADPKNAIGYQTLGMVALRQEQPAQAKQYLDHALELNPQLPIAWNTLGVARYQLEGAVPALEAWQRAVDLDPHQFDALFNLGLVAAQAGRREQARTALRQFVATAPPARADDVRKARGVLRELGG